MAPHPHPQEDKSDRHSAGASREQERRPSKAWGILIFGLIGVTTASFAVRAPLLPLLRLCSLEFPRGCLSRMTLLAVLPASLVSVVSLACASTYCLVAVLLCVGQLGIK